MQRWVLVAVALVGLCGLVRADRAWPAGFEGAEALENFGTSKAEITKYKNKYKWHDPDYVPPHSSPSYPGFTDDGTISGEPGTTPSTCLGSRQGITVSDPLNSGLTGGCPGPLGVVDPSSSLVAPCNSANLTNPDNALCAGTCITADGRCGYAQPGCSNQFEFRRYGSAQVKSHFENQPGPFQLVDPRHHTFSCVDARGEEPMLGTPGGDLAEIQVAAMAFLKLRGLSTDDAITAAANEVFELFYQDVATESRPLYLHTADSNLRKMFVEIGGGNTAATPPVAPNVATMPNIMPWKAPADYLTKWLPLLKTATYNGCGHIRLMLQSSGGAPPAGGYTIPFYSVLANRAGSVQPCDPAVVADCISSQKVMGAVIEAFFKKWWPTPAGSTERKKTSFLIDNILQGPLVGKAVAIISNVPAGGDCTTYAPLVIPSFGASQVFVYHGDAVAQWRAYVVNDVLGQKIKTVYGIEPAAWLAAWNAIAGQQLGATLTYLQPANNNAFFGVGIPVKDVGTNPYPNPPHYPKKGHYKTG